MTKKNPNQLPMFMTGKEIQQNINPSEGEKYYKKDSTGKIRKETNEEVWNRKYQETGLNENAYPVAGANHGEGYKNLREDVSERGIMHSIIPVNFDKNEVLGGHHRVALAAKEHPEHVFSLVQFRNILHAKDNLWDQETNY